MSYETRMKEWITDHDIRQKVLAKEFHVTEAALSNYLTGRSTITLDVLVKFAKRSGLSMDYLVGLSDEPIPPMPLTESERQLIEHFRTLHPTQKELIVKNIAIMQEQNQRA
ncbi:MAG: helix-turn-helix domain-containing protein [Lawsonibacter sp.]|nr:helix-turn-helix domain-containing protein [Lawsonibacter sp.]